MISLAQPLRADQSLPAPPPQKIQELIELLRDPALANWLVEETKAKAAQDAVRPPPTLQQRLEEKLRAGRGRVVSALNGFGLLGFELEMARSKIATELADYGFTRGWQLIVAFIGLGLGSLWVAFRLTRRSWDELSSRPITSVHDRLMVILGRTEISVVRMLAFTIGSLGLFLLFDWPPLVRTLLIGVLTAAQGLVGALILASLALAPDESDLQARELRLIPLTDVDAISWSRRIAVFGGTLGLAVVTRSLFERLGINADSATAAQYIFVIALALVAL